MTADTVKDCSMLNTLQNITDDVARPVVYRRPEPQK